MGASSSRLRRKGLHGSPVVHQHGAGDSQNDREKSGSCELPSTGGLALVGLNNLSTSRGSTKPAARTPSVIFVY